MLGAELNGLSLTVVAIVNFDNAATGFIDYDAVGSPIVLIEIADNAYEKEQSENDTAAREVDNGSNILRIAVDGRKSQASRLMLELETLAISGLSFSICDLFNTTSSPSGSVDYVISDEDGKGSWIRQPVWSEFGEKRA